MVRHASGAPRPIRAAGAYRATPAAAKAGTLGTVPPAVATFVTTAMAQHTGHAKAWNAVLAGAGKPTFTGVSLTNQPATLAALGKAADPALLTGLSLPGNASARYPAPRRGAVTPSAR